jgi:DNA-binding protein HU-beta/integration host factor subunit alpha
MPTITKRDLALRITDQLGEQGHTITQNAVAEILQCLISEIGEALARGDSVAMRKFGTFEVREMKAKVGRNPKNPAKDVRIPARAVVKFKPGNELKEKVAATLPLIRENRS